MRKRYNEDFERYFVRNTLMYCSMESYWRLVKLNVSLEEGQHGWEKCREQVSSMDNPNCLRVLSVLLLPVHVSYL